MFQPTGPVEFRGVPFKFGGGTIIVPAIRYDDAEAMAAAIDDATNPADVRTTEQIMAMTREEFAEHTAKARIKRQHMKKIIGVAIRRNYPNFSDDDLSKFVDYDNGQAAFYAALGSTPADTKKIQDPGELKPAENAGPK